MQFGQVNQAWSFGEFERKIYICNFNNQVLYLYETREACSKVELETANTWITCYYFIQFNARFREFKGTTKRLMSFFSSTYFRLLLSTTSFRYTLLVK